MTRQPLSRRDFLKLGGLSFGALALQTFPARAAPWPPEEDGSYRPIVVRVATSSIYIYKEPDFNSDRIGTIRRDSILHIPEEVISPKGPVHNPLWYRLVSGFVHSGYLQRVEKQRLNQPLPWIAESGQLAEITVPFTRSMRYSQTYGWQPLYRLYYESVFWITSIDEGPDGKPWYGLMDDLLHVKYHVPAEHMRPITWEEVSPISPHVPTREKRIEISIRDQTVTAYEGDQVVLHVPVSTGIPSRGPSPNGIPTDTPEGHWHVEVKVPSRHMGDGDLTDDIEAYELPGVPWVSFFHIDGIALHGTYWHNNFGRMMSHGCVNMRNDDARWIYRWTYPSIEPEDWHGRGHGTLVHVL